MSKNIILLSDGTGNAASKVWRTNVWRVFQALDLKRPDQIAIYDDGVGTSSFIPLAILSGAFGWGLKRNVLDLYKFLCRNYESGDQIYGFGFSRGAFTIRVVIGLVLHQGLVEFATEGDLASKAAAAYRAYRYGRFSPWNLQFPFRALRYFIDKLSYTPKQRTVEEIAFLGLWDTVAAYGLPVDEMTRGVNKWLWPLELPDQEFNPKILKARHALSIDDERATFHPILWNENSSNTKTAAEMRDPRDEPLRQVWFSGVHSNVGGGYPDDSLAHVSLSWMLAEAEQAGLKFKEIPNAEPDALISTDAAKDKDGRLYDSRSGLGGYYRYSPRRISDFYDDMRRVIEKRNTKKRKENPNAATESFPSLLPKIHQSVFGRLKAGAHLYAPIGLPPSYEIVTTGNVGVSFTPPAVTPSLIQIKPNSVAIAEGAAAAKDRHSAQEFVWDGVWRKRAIYFLSVFATSYLLIYPLYRDNYAFQELRTRLRLISDTFELLGSFLPHFASRWLEAWERDPGWFLVAAGLVAFLTWISARLAGRITDRMRGIWVTSLPNSNAAPKKDDKLGDILSVVLDSLLFVASGYLAFYPLFDHFNWLHWLSLPGEAGEALTAYTALPFCLILILFWLFYFLPRPLIRWLRQSTPYQWALWGLKTQIVPSLSAALLLWFAMAIGSHYLFDLRDSFGAFCPNATPGLSASHPGFDAKDPKTGKPQKTITFDTSPNALNKPGPLCLSTGVFVETGATYRIVVQRLPVVKTDTPPPQGQWTFFGETSYMGGQPISRLPFWKGVIMALLYPTRRTLDRPWGAILLRIGDLGNEEDFLDRDPPPQSDEIVRAKVFGVPIKSEVKSEKLKPGRDGELFIYLNKPVLALPGFETFFADRIGNDGVASVTISVADDG